MSALKSGWWLFAASLVAILALRTTTTSGQSAAGTIDTMSALLQEVHGLRVAMERMTSAGSRVQLALGRLQLQEQRVNDMARRLDALHDQRTDAEREAADTRAQMARLDEAAAAIENVDERRAIAQQSQSLATALEQRTADAQRLASEEDRLSNAIAAEQARWNDINRQLEELERLLAR